MYSNSQLKEAYRSLNEKVVSSVSTDDVVDFLFEKFVLPETKYSELSDGTNEMKRTRKLMALLHTSGHPEAFIKFHEAIKKKNCYDWLSKQVYDICTQQTAVMSTAVKLEQKGKITDNGKK
jgi:Caspase recruitment domain